MKSCGDCGSKHEVKVLNILSITGSGKVKKVMLCVRCMLAKRLYCDEHGRHICITSDPDMLEIRSACPGCAIRAAKLMDSNLRLRLSELVRNRLGAELLKELMMYGAYGDTHEEKAMIGICLLGAFYSRTPEETVNDLIADHDSTALTH